MNPNYERKPMEPYNALSVRNILEVVSKIFCRISEKKKEPSVSYKSPKKKEERRKKKESFNGGIITGGPKWLSLIGGVVGGGW